jgi:hypothetical protein
MGKVRAQPLARPPRGNTACPQLEKADAASPAHPLVNLQKLALESPQRFVILDAELCQHARGIRVSLTSQGKLNDLLPDELCHAICRAGGKLKPGAHSVRLVRGLNVLGVRLGMELPTCGVGPGPFRRLRLAADKSVIASGRLWCSPGAATAGHIADMKTSPGVHFGAPSHIVLISLVILARPKRFELLTPRFVVRCFHPSYRSRRFFCNRLGDVVRTKLVGNH